MQLADIWGATDKEEPIDHDELCREMFNAGIREGVRQNMVKVQKWIKKQEQFSHIDEEFMRDAIGIKPSMLYAIQRGDIEHLVHELDALAEAVMRIKRYESLR